MLRFRQSKECQPFVVFANCPYSTAAQTSSSSKPTFYEVLNVSETATSAEIRNAFIKKSKEFHPDVNPSKRDLHETFVQISEAYNVLSNARSRHSYDLKLQRAFFAHAPSQSNTSNPFGSVPPHRQPYHYPDMNATSSSTYRTRPMYNHSSVSMNAEKKRNNRLIVVGAVAFMLTGAAIHFLILRNRHKQFQAKLEESNRKANQLYTEARERARANGLKGQLEQLIHVSQNTGLDKVAAIKSLQDFYGDKK